MSSPTSYWIISSSDIKLGGSAILGGNRFAFYSIHYIGIVNLSISIISCVLVITHILVNYFRYRSRMGHRTKFDFSQRFPLYLSIADFLWGLSHFAEQLYVIVTEKYPTGWTVILLSANMYCFLGYQQLMHACLAIYTYLRIVHMKTLELGAGEWRLHLFCFSLVGFSTIFFYFLKSFGCSGYWFLDESTSLNGTWIRIWVCSVMTFNAVSNRWGYQLIEQKVREQDERKHRTLSTTTHVERVVVGERSYALASKCLATFVRNATYSSCPWAISCWVYTIFKLFGYVQPLTSFIIVNIANSSGSVTAWGFYHNEKLKRKARLHDGSTNLSSVC